MDCVLCISRAFLLKARILLRESGTVERHDATERAAALILALTSMPLTGSSLQIGQNAFPAGFHRSRRLFAHHRNPVWLSVRGSLVTFLCVVDPVLDQRVRGRVFDRHACGRICGGSDFSFDFDRGAATTTNHAD